LHDAIAGGSYDRTAQAGKFLTSPLEKKVFELFKSFIEQNKKPAPI